ncbi:MAG: EamA family transporter [Trichormus sp. ATA11-4-KO1]|jgi:drug/metabolite transporter (DMT)-like permease/uncharacterized protein (UPF0335 family)|nr:EamA family transporter [Trichormus sp. ATA11-4-KO1]
MGRFEKRPDNPRVRGELSRAAETALWAVVEDLESLQQNMLRSLQEEIKRLQAEKTRLSDEIQHLLEEKEHLQQVRQITEQQVLIRQLSEALAKHISSQLQSSLANLVSQSVVGNSHERSALKSAGENNENAEKMLGTLDDTLTITFNSLQQELKNYQSNLSQQLSRMYSQQQQGEAIVEQLINHLRGELVKTTKEISLAAVKASPPTVVQPTEQQPPSSSQTRLQLGEINSSVAEPISTITEDLSKSNTTPPPTLASSSSNIVPLSKAKSSESNSVISREEFERDNQFPPDQENTTESNSVISREEFERDNQFPPDQENTTESNSVISREEFERDNQFPPDQENTTESNSVISREEFERDNQFSPDQENTTESNSVISREEFERDNQFPPDQQKVSQQNSVLRREALERNTQSPPDQQKVGKPNSVLSREALENNTQSPPSPATKQEAKPASSRSNNSQTLSPIQIGFLLVVLSTVVSSLYNVAIKGMFYKAYDNLGVLEIEGLISPTLGNILLILMLRLLVVVPLMLLLAPIMHPQVWQDMQNLVESVRGNSNPNSSVKTQRLLQLSIASGCFLFLSQVLIYLAIGQVATGMAIALFFVYPMIGGLLSWLLFRDRPSGFRSAAIGSIFCGELLVLGGSASFGMANFSLGSSTAIFAGVAFACYVILTRICAAKLHPVSFTLINFTTMFVLSFICLMLPLPSGLNLAVDPSKLLELILSAFILGVLTLVGYVLNNVGIRKLGALRSAIIGAGVPILTVVFAGLMLQETLEIVQIMGVLFVTFGVAAYSFEKMRNQVKSSSSEN